MGPQQQKPEANKPSKRLDLQGIRGLAIISVLGFHFFPSIFPNGYLGVDQFFVLSGFLMCMLLKKTESKPCCTLVATFYSRRFKRILPLYFLIIFIAMIALYNFFPDTAIENNVNSASRALLFVSNRPATDSENYFKMLEIAIDIFTHTWSLSVEIQFYFLVPLIFIFGNKLPSSYHYSYYAVIGLISLAYHVVSSPTVAFNSVFARIWQFSIGMVVYLISQNGVSLQQNEDYSLLIEEVEEGMEKVEVVDEDIDSISTKKITTIQTFKYILLISMVWIVTYPLMIPSVLARPFFTIATGFLMSISMDDPILSNKYLTYVGDISYSLYLIHWPIYAYWKLTMKDHQEVLILCLFISIILAIITFETYEKWYLTLSSTTIGCIVVVLIILNVIVINKDEIQDQLDGRSRNFSRLDGLTDEMTMDDAVKLNYKWSVDDNKNLLVPTCDYENRYGPLGWCRQTGLDKNSKYKIMLFGNSWTSNHGQMIYQECHHKAYSMLQGSAYGCEALYAKAPQMCVNNYTDFANRIKEFQPDYAFMISRFVHTATVSPIAVNKTEDDPVYQDMEKQLDVLLKSVNKKLFILHSIPRVKANQIGNIVPSIRKGVALKDIDWYLVDFTSYELARSRFEKLFEHCGDKCVKIDYVPEFWNNSTQTFRYYDEKGFSYFTTPNHLSPHGLEHVRHLYRDICRKL